MVMSMNGATSANRTNGGFANSIADGVHTGAHTGANGQHSRHDGNRVLHRVLETVREEDEGKWDASRVPRPVQSCSTASY